MKCFIPPSRKGSLTKVNTPNALTIRFGTTYIYHLPVCLCVPLVFFAWQPCLFTEKYILFNHNLLPFPRIFRTLRLAFSRQQIYIDTYNVYVSSFSLPINFSPFLLVRIDLMSAALWCMALNSLMNVIVANKTPSESVIFPLFSGPFCKLVKRFECGLSRRIFFQF